ncbi:hypothetical protein WJX81_006825 [Elliptochloris bilobata]|uniref:MATH domain-containing protein n=1 Tax=Elliptochloris bilobata TaxID=381761 RepID=A0AAW1RKL0_9CHLO
MAQGGQARLREALQAGGPGSQKEKGPPVADGILTVTPDTPEAVEWRTRRSIIDSAGASSSYLEDESGPKPAELYGKFTWKIENFFEISKRELRSTVFEVGSYKWYILVYPQGCDVCNHLSLFLCVADYDKLLPGWSHFAQFTIAVVNKDPKKSKYSDTLHRFCKKEHDWGWKKFMELNKVMEGFTVSNNLVIKAQVQVIRDRPNAPFLCLDAQYRRELVRVYLTNVEALARKFVDEKRDALARLRDDAAGFRAFWAAVDARTRRQLATASGEAVLKGVVKRFFNEKEVTSTLVMDALYSGCKQLEEASRLADAKKAKKAGAGTVVVSAERGTWSLAGDVLALLERVACESIPPFRDDKAADPLASRNAQDADEYSKDYVERDERRLTELGRRAVEMFAAAHIFAALQEAHSEAESIKRQDALIQEEEEAGRAEDARAAARAAAEREKKARKKERQRVKKAAEAAQREEEAAAQREADAARQAETDRRAEQEAAQRAADEALRERERLAALRKAAATYRAREASRLEAAEVAQRERCEPDAAASRGGAAGTTGREEEGLSGLGSGAAGAPPGSSEGGRSSASGDDEDDEDDGLSSGSGSGSGGGATGTGAEGAASASQPQARAPPRGHIEYLQAQLATANKALAATRAETAAAQAATAEQRRAHAAALDARGADIATLRGALAEQQRQHAALAAAHAALQAAHAALQAQAAGGAGTAAARGSTASSLGAAVAADGGGSALSETSGDSRSESRASSLDLSGSDHPLNGSYGRGLQPGQHVMPPYSTPVATKRADHAGPAESPGLDDFAHMGLITDLLD